jgi:hypothetical protein
MDGLCLFDRLAVALDEVTVNNKYEMSTSDDPISDSLSKRFPDLQAPLLMGLVAELSSLNLVYLLPAPSVRTADYRNQVIELTVSWRAFCHASTPRCLVIPNYQKHPLTEPLHTPIGVNQNSPEWGLTSPAP